MDIAGKKYIKQPVQISILKYTDVSRIFRVADDSLIN